MTGHDDFDRTLVGWFEADALSPGPADAHDRVLDVTRRRRPRPAWLADLGSQWVGEASDGGWIVRGRSLPGLERRWATAFIVLLVIAALVGGAIVVGARLLHLTPLPNDRAFHLAYGLDGDIYVADWDGGNPVRIADGAPADNGPGCQDFRGEGRMWSPDGLHLAYRSGCRGMVLISDVTGKVVAEFPGDGWLVSWSPDSTRVATWVDLSKTVGIYGLDGVRQALLTVWDGCAPGGDWDPIWSPDGTSVMIRSCEVPLDGRTPGRPSTDDPRAHRAWAYSPDGTRAAYSSGTLVVAAPDGSGPRVLVPDGVMSLMWSPKGDGIAFVWNGTASSFDLAGNPIPSADELRMVDVTTGTVKSLAVARGTESVRVIRFSPDGGRILFSRTNAAGEASLWSVRVDGSDARLLVMGTDWGDWQPLPAGR